MSAVHNTEVLSVEQMLERFVYEGRSGRVIDRQVVRGQVPVFTHWSSVAACRRAYAASHREEEGARGSVKIIYHVDEWLRDPQRRTIESMAYVSEIEPQWRD
jgi:hypothetical protein